MISLLGPNSLNICRRTALSSLMLSLALMFMSATLDAKTLQKTKKASKRTPSQVETKDVYADPTKKEIRDWVESIPKLRKLVTETPDNFQLQFEFGRALYYDGKLDEALEHLKIANQDPSVSLLKLLARIYAEKKDDLQVIRAFEVLLEAKPNDFQARTDLADAYVRTRKYDLAIENYKRALKVYSKYRKAYEGLLNVYGLKKSSYESRELLAEMANMFPTDPMIQSLLCKNYILDNFFEKAMDHCKVAMKLDPKLGDNMTYYGLAQRGKLENREGVETIFRAAKKYTNSEVVQMTAAKTSDAQKSWEASARYYRNVLKLNPKLGEAALGVAVAEFRADSFETALKSFMYACPIEHKTYTELVKATGLLLSRKQEKWYNEYRKAQDRCSYTKALVDSPI